MEDMPMLSRSPAVLPRLLALAFALLLSLGLAAGPAAAQTEQMPNPDIEATIGAQLEAFKADDFDEAFTYAAPNIQGIFQTPDRFGQMVRNGYPMVWRPGAVRYLDLREIAGALWQRVEITDAQGNLHWVDYQMRRIDGDWRIAGVQVLRPPAMNV
jgi:hypothetical protein